MLQKPAGCGRLDMSRPRSKEINDAAPPVHHRMMITIHLLMCKYCNRFRKQPMILRNAVRLEKLPEDHPSPPGSLSKATVRGLKRPPERSRLDKI